jgi:hypothetical protein
MCSLINLVMVDNGNKLIPYDNMINVIFWFDKSILLNTKFHYSKSD